MIDVLNETMEEEMQGALGVVKDANSDQEAMGNLTERQKCAVLFLNGCNHRVEAAERVLVISFPNSAVVVVEGELKAVQKE